MKPAGGTATGEALATSLAMLRARRGRTAAPARRDRAALGRELDGRPRPAGGGRRGEAPAHPRLHRRARDRGGHAAQRRPGAAGHGGAAGHRATLGRQAFTAGEASSLSAVYERLGSQVATKREEREVTGAFAGGALLLLARRAAGCRCAGSAGWFELALKLGGFTVAMHAAGLRRMGFAAVLATGALMLGSAFVGMTRVDDTLELAAAAPPERPIYVIDAAPAQQRTSCATARCGGSSTTRASDPVGRVAVSVGLRAVS